MNNIPDEEISTVLTELCSSDEEDIFDLYDSDADPVYQPNLDELSSESNEETVDRVENEINLTLGENETNVTVQHPAAGDIGHYDTTEGGAVTSTWGPVGESNSNNFVFNPSNEPCGVNSDILETMQSCVPVDFFELFVTNEVIIHLVTETNRYANSRKAAAQTPPSARILKWVDTNVAEMKRFLAITMWMGMMILPSFAHYWKKNSLFYTKVSHFMSRNRYELLLANFHCSNNSAALPGDRLHKVQHLINMVIEYFRDAYVPEESMCIDESIIPFRGRVVFRQYLPNKSHRYGIKVFKLCVKDHYTIAYNVYAGKEATSNSSVSTKIVLQLTGPYLNFGRTIYVDNWYTSVTLAHELIKCNTHLVGTLRKNRKYNPKNVISKRLRKGEAVAAMDSKNVMVLKWRDRREVLILSTKHVDNIITYIKQNKIIKKPQAVIEYNKGKTFIDLADQMSAYHSSCLRRSVKWYRKVAFDLLLNTAVVNALSLYKLVTKTTISVTDFRESILNSWLDNNTVINVQPSRAVVTHELQKTTRGRCKLCYKNLVINLGRKEAILKTKKVQLKCSQCNERMCKDCFFKTHSAEKAQVPKT